MSLALQPDFRALFNKNKECCFPRRCKPRHSFALVIPFRSRELHLSIMLPYVIRMLRKQGNRFKIFLVEQMQNQTFNKAKLLNVGFDLVQKDLVAKNYGCMIVHDVDFIPVDQNFPYRCFKAPSYMTFNTQFSIKLRTP